MASSDDKSPFPSFCNSNEVFVRRSYPTRTCTEPNDRRSPLSQDLEHVLSTLPDMLAYCVAILDAPRVSFQLYFLSLPEMQESFKVDENSKKEALYFWKRKLVEMRLHVAGTRPATHPELIDRLRNNPKAEACNLKNAGNVFFKRGQNHIANALYSICIGLDENNAVYWSNRAAVEIRLCEFSSAVIDCMHAIGHDPNFVRPRKRLAKAYRLLGHTSMEIVAIKSAIRLAPGDVELQEQLQSAQNRLKGIDSETHEDEEESIEDMKVMARNFEDGPEIYMELARVYAEEYGKEFNREKAMELFEKGKAEYLELKQNPDRRREMHKLVSKNTSALSSTPFPGLFGDDDFLGDEETAQEGKREGEWKIVLLD